MARILLITLANLAVLATCGCGRGAENPSPPVPEKHAEPPDAAAEEEPNAGDEEAPGPHVPFFMRKADVKLLSPEEQQAVLARRTTGAIAGDFNSYADLLYGVSDVVIAAEDETILSTQLKPVFEEDYRPTFRELFDAIGRQTRSVWAYSEERKAWLFAKPAPPLPFAIAAAQGWNVEDRGLTVLYKAPGLPIGLEVYVFGRYSADNNDEAAALAGKARNACAVNFARLMKKDARLEDMQKTVVGGSEALYFECPTPKAGHTWRQWAVATKEHRVFALISVLPNDRDAELLAALKNMVASFASPPTAKGADAK